MYSMYLEKSENSSQVGRKTMIRGILEKFFFGAIVSFSFGCLLFCLRLQIAIDLFILYAKLGPIFSN